MPMLIINLLNYSLFLEGFLTTAEMRRRLCLSFMISSILKILPLFSVEDLQKFLDVTKTPYTGLLCKQNNAAFITCEYLIAFDAKIVLSSDNILHFNNQMLPEKIIVMANVSQIVEDLSEAMSRIKRKSHIKKITSISGGKSNLDNPNKKYPKLFLLLLED